MKVRTGVKVCTGETMFQDLCRHEMMTRCNKTSNRAVVRHDGTALCLPSFKKLDARAEKSRSHIEQKIKPGIMRKSNLL